MADKTYLGWPFFEPRHAALEQELDAWAAQHVTDAHGSDVDEAIEMEAQAQAILMQNQDFRRAYEAFAAKQKPVFQGD